VTVTLGKFITIQKQILFFLFLFFWEGGVYLNPVYILRAIDLKYRIFSNLIRTLFTVSEG